jgi:hypothetical protein
MGREQEEAAFKVSWSLNGEPCEVYFFRRWAGYSHPVRPVDPIKYEEALKSSGFCRVFLRRMQGSERIVFFQAIKVARLSLKLQLSSSEGNRYFEVTRTQEKVGAGQAVQPDQAVMLDEFIHVSPRQKAPPSSSSVELVTNSVGYSYQYSYNAGGALQQVVITTPEGRNVLDY